MLPSTVRLAAIARTPLIKFLGPRSALNEAHHEATRHPAAPKDAAYPLKAGAPVKASPSTSSSSSSKPAQQGPLGTSRHVLDFTELPARYRHPQLTEAEIEAVETGGATAIF
ncbi:hypothetical protein BGZ83_010320 [Gryganskiella cystojenkinii]|nr:hypothetical protein BGZ83_010320 [Gryganskiella cystojenkinii]